MTKIEIVAGCTKVSPGCDHCYAERMAVRLAGNMSLPEDVQRAYCQATDRGVIEKAGWSGKVVPIPGAVERLAAKCASWRKPRRVFVQSMGDLFHDAVPRELQRKVFATFHNYPQHIFQILTKRPENMRAFIRWYAEWVGFNAWPREYSHVWLGVTAENQEQADARIPVLLDTPAAVRFVSVEPMLGAVDLKNIDGPIGRGLSHIDALTGKHYHDDDGGQRTDEYDALDWVICGGETGPGARMMSPQWARELRDQCASAGVPYFFNKLGDYCKDKHYQENYGLNVREFPQAGRWGHALDANQGRSETPPGLRGR